MGGAFDAEVIVAGAGPAGAVAARTLAAAGVDTLLVDRAAFPRNKPCGGGISTRALGRFPWLQAALASIDVHRVSRLHLEGPDRAVLRLASPRPSVLLVRRVEFDAALVTAATGAGARLTSGFDVAQARIDDAGAVVLTARDGRTCRAPALVAADGVHSVVAKRLGVNVRWPRTHVALDMMEETPMTDLCAADPDLLWVAYAHDRLDGYAYVFPKARHVNAGIGCLLSHFDAEVDARPYDLQRAFVDGLVARGVLSGASARGRFTPFLIPVGGPLKRTRHGPVVFAGDAGGFVNAITAEGIYYAMVTGELAGRAMAGARPAFAPTRVAAAGRQYERLWRAEVGTELRDATVLQRYLFSRHSRVARVIRGAAGMPWLTDRILEYFRGERSYPEVRRTVLIRFPAAALRLARERFAMRTARAS